MFGGNFSATMSDRQIKENGVQQEHEEREPLFESDEFKRFQNPRCLGELISDDKQGCERRHNPKGGQRLVQKRFSLIATLLLDPAGLGNNLILRFVVHLPPARSAQPTQRASSF